MRPGESPSLTYDRVLDILKSHDVSNPRVTHDFSDDFTVFNLSSSSSSDPLDQLFDDIGGEANRLARVKQICRSLCETIQDPHDHLEKLDNALSAYLQYDAINCGPDYSSTASQAYQVLTRVSIDDQPYIQLGAEEDCRTLPEGFFALPDGEPRLPQHLRVSGFFDRNTICAALHLFLNPPTKRSWSGFGISLYVDFLAQLLNGALEMGPAEISSTPGYLLVVRAFLWVSWQRCLMLHRWSLFQFGSRSVLDLATDRQKTDFQRLARTVAAPTIQWTPPSGIPPSMCPWGFTLLRAHPAATGVNLAYFMSVYEKHFSSRPARCVPCPDGSYRQCKGDGPASCSRFTGAVIKDQSAHRAGCRGECPRLYWDENSYRGVDGARAVDLDAASDGLLRYRVASDATLAISHVWSHGQGGRPEQPKPGLESTGFNRCLHERYSSIAHHMGCDSYWIDTACIPQDHQLRREAISHINGIFKTSLLTLVCERDIMAIDIADKTVAVMESVLASLLVCDWNLRAWTLLEGVRGVANIHLLCKDDEILSLKEVITATYTDGRLSLASLSLTIDHLHAKEPPATAVSERTFALPPYYTVERAATLLRHRHASREGDEVVIWSLLCGGLAYTAEEFWRQCGWIRTGFLLSHAPRVEGVRGLSWAPRRPDFRPDAQHTTSLGLASQRNILEATDTLSGVILDNGLRAEWNICQMENLQLLPSMIQSAQVLMELVHLPRHFFRVQKTRAVLHEASYYWYMAWASPQMRRRLRSIAAETHLPIHQLALIRAISEGPVPFMHNADSRGTPLALIAATGTGTWIWIKVLHWDEACPLPSFISKHIVIE